MSETIKPIGSRVLILPTPLEKVLASGLVIPDAVSDKQGRGTVVAVGSDTKILEVGDSVLFNKHDDDIEPIEVERVEHLLLTESRVLAVVTE